MLKTLGTPFICSTVVVGFLTLLFYEFGSAVLIHLLFPGLAVGLMLTGGHGGTHLEENLALALGMVVNIAFYWIVFRFLSFALARRKKHRQRAETVEKAP